MHVVLKARAQWMYRRRHQLLPCCCHLQVKNIPCGDRFKLSAVLGDPVKVGFEEKGWESPWRRVMNGAEVD
jgi:hypothetical protein